MDFQPHYWSCSVGSFPHLDDSALCERILDCIDIPVWPQLPKRDFRENMYVQYSAALPRIVLDESRQKIYFDTRGDISGSLEAFYERYLADDLEAFGLAVEYANGFYTMLERLGSMDMSDDPGDPSSWAKGHVTGPISMGLTISDQDLRASLYNEMLADTLVKNAAMNARWQVRILKSVRPYIIIFVDEPYMASYGSAYIGLSRESAVAMLDEVFEAIHAEGALAGVHCCANTDWSVLMSTKVDILSLDSYGYLDNLTLYPIELRSFLDRGGAIAWGLVPNTPEVFDVNPESLAERLTNGLELITARGGRSGVVLDPREIAHRSLVATSCGLGPATEAVAERALDILFEIGDILR